MCSPSVPKPPPPPPKKPDFRAEEIELSAAVEDQRRKSAQFAGLAGTIKQGAQGVLTPTNTTGGLK